LGKPTVATAPPNFAARLAANQKAIFCDEKAGLMLPEENEILRQRLD